MLFYFIFVMFLHPIVYWKYPDSMVEIVGKRMPKFTKEQYQMIKGSIDYLGVNQYTAYYMYDPQQPKQNVIGYQIYWNVGFACKILYALRLQSHLFFYLAYSVVELP
jgi:beta-glucosidase/6-phospho-beta-glucosidase/beta-galactosidase